MRFVAFSLSLGVLILAGGMGFFNLRQDIETGLLIPLILTILILLFAAVRQRSTFLEKENFHETQMQQMAHSFAAERRAFIQKEKAIAGTLREKVHEIRLLQNQHQPSAKTDKPPEPTYSRLPPELYHTNPYWTALSDWYRDERNWRCEHCEIDLEQQKRFLHTHHTRGRAYNSPEHLKALCIRCHADEKSPIDHSFMKNSREYKEFVDFYFRRLHNKA